MGEVWRAHDTAANNRIVAIKLLPPHLFSESTVRKGGGSLALLSVIGTPQPPWWQRQRRQVKVAIITAIVVILATSCGQHPAPNPAPSQTQTAQPVPPSGARPSAQTVLPFTGLRQPAGVVVDAAGDLYVTDSGNDRVVKLGAGSSTQTVLPFTGLGSPHGVAVDTAGNLYVVDSSNDRVLKLAAG